MQGRIKYGDFTSYSPVVELTLIEAKRVDSPKIPVLLMRFSNPTQPSSINFSSDVG
jgi:hypothetical protein